MKQSNSRGLKTNPSVEKMVAHEARHDAGASQKHGRNGQCSFNSYKKSAKKREYRGHELEFEDSLAQCESQVSLQGGEDRNASGFNHYRPKRRVSKSPSKSPMRRQQHQMSGV